MTRRTVSRRQFAAVLGTAVGVGLAGCGGTTGNNSTNATNGTVGTVEEMTEGDEETEGSPTETPEPPETTDDPAAAVEEGNAVVRIAHLSPDAPNVDVSVGGAEILTDVAYGTVSDYYVLEPSTYAVAVAPTGEDDAVFEQDVEFTSGAFTVGALGELAEQRQSFAVEAFEDRVEAPDAETAAVRVVHASPDAPAVSVAVQGGDTLVEEVAFGEASDYVEVPAGDYTLDIAVAGGGGDAGTETAGGDETGTETGNETDGGTDTGTAAETVAPGTVVASADVSLPGASVASAFATGYVSPDGEAADAPFEVLTTVDATASEDETGTAEGTETGTESGTEAGTESGTESGTEAGTEAA
ncbi:DUF4397 domain-containing protein [Halobaculum limi]|uniref:DUF4397 domain-containing protein n=1 Tax=Halobaculum limi TaxID=3031916 RepID=UPI002407114A|nr:DUF4397 domain-containing protein [Halobaculum sp. YSMS11]